MTPPTFSLGAALEVDLRSLDGHELARAVEWAAHAPRGASVTFEVARGQVPPHLALRYLCDHGRHLGTVQIRCSDPDSANRWLLALREAQADSDAALEAEAGR
ncbi:hypothetical protein [Sinomonas sp. P47F7]|uniref:hypothetical protein n=1 Tax=Sinomonas sp. P47F7 TaxID=3410987 RepID=UPI003BF5FF3B